MGISERDGESTTPICWSSGLGNSRGQGTIEYVLVLVVAVAIIMGGLYQLNTAFKVWANNYFGDYLSCILETGELPTIGGAGGDSGICDQLFKPFSLAEGRPLKGQGAGGGGEDEAAKRRNEANARRSAGGGGGGGGYGGTGRFTGGRGASSTGAKARKKVSLPPTNTGSTRASDYGSGYNYTQAPQHKRSQKLDNKFAFDEEREQKQKKRSVAAAKKRGDGTGERVRVKLKDAAFAKKSSATSSDTDFNIGNFIKYILIICIILALLFFLGGQALSISKSMD